jgi:hypothetical protein
MAAKSTGISWLEWGGLSVLLLGGLVLLWCNHGASTSAAADKVPEPIEIDEERVMKYLDAVCAIGPRISGTEGMTKQQTLIEKHFTGLGAKVRYQKFTGKQPRKRPVEMANMIVSYNPDAERRVILCCHYDTRPIADQENNPRRWKEPFVSANDGGSGVALLMEMGHHMKKLKLSVGVDFVFFDGEEYIHDPSEDESYYFLGSRHFAREYGKIRKQTKYTAAILLDMIAGKGAEFPMEQNSVFHAGKLVREVWDIAAELKCEVFTKGMSKVAVNDDHIPLNEGGIPAIDIIDFEYPHWHKLTDVPKNCSAKPMTQVAKVLSLWLQRQK